MDGSRRGGGRGEAHTDMLLWMLRNDQWEVRIWNILHTNKPQHTRTWRASRQLLNMHPPNNEATQNARAPLRSPLTGLREHDQVNHPAARE